MTEYHNPNQEPGMDRRLLLVFAVTFVILLVFQPALMKYMRKGEPAQSQQPQQQAPAAVQPQAPSAVAPAATAAAPGAAKQAGAEREIVIENDLYHIVFTNKGAQVKSWILRKYTDDQGKPLELVNQGASVEEQQDGQTVRVPAVERYGYPMSLWTYDEALRTKLNSVLYVPAKKVTTLRAIVGGKEPEPVPAAPAEDQPIHVGPDTGVELTFEYSDGQIAVRKTFRFDDSYLIKVQTETRNAGQLVPAYLAWPAGFGDQTIPASYSAARIDYQLGEKATRVDAKKVSGGATLNGPFNWAGTVDQYFGAVFLPDQPDNVALVMLHNDAAIPKNLDKPDPKEMATVPLLGVAVGNPRGVTSGRWFVGPKSVDVVDKIKSAPAAGQSAAPTLGAMLDFGFFGWVGKPLFLWLKWTQAHWAANWGWAITILTVIINVALLPLRVSSMKSALKMQKVQPQVNAIKKKYEKFSMRDPRKAEMNKEIAAVFKEHGVNPAGGCLPMIIQLPFLWAFYTMLSVAIELRHAPWLWVKDLSSPDPMHILPVLIVVSTFAMQKMTPSPGMDPNQQRMMLVMMPVMLGVFAWSFASGLSLYWLVGTVISIVQQMVMNRTALGQEIQEISEKRARKKKALAR